MHKSSLVTTHSTQGLHSTTIFEVTFDQCDQIWGNFYKFLAKNCFLKVAQIIW